MKYILTNQIDYIYGTFTSVEQTTDGYIADGVPFTTQVYGALTLSEVADDYMTPAQIIDFNNQQKHLRAKAYLTNSDPIFFQYQAGVKTQQDWIDARNSVQAQLPYKE